MSFIPGDLHLNETPNGYVLVIGRAEVFRTQSARAAVTRFNRIRAEMEKNGLHPAPDPKVEQIPQRTPGDLAVQASTPHKESARPKVKRKLSVPSSVSIEVPGRQKRRVAQRAKKHKLAAEAQSNIPDALAPRAGVHQKIQSTLAGIRSKRERIVRTIAVIEKLGMSR